MKIKNNIYNANYLLLLLFIIISVSIYFLNIQTINSFRNEAKLQVKFLAEKYSEAINKSDTDEIQFILDIMLPALNFPIIIKSNDELYSTMNIQSPYDFGTVEYIEYINQPSNFNLRKKIIFVAKQFIGVPYLWGGKTSKGFDCSGFVQSIFKFCGISLERDTNQMILNQKLIEIDFIKSKPGDLVFFHNNNIINHVAMSIGNGDIIHSSGEVSIDTLFTEESSELSSSIYKTFSIDKFIDND